MEFKWQYVWVAMVFTGVILGLVTLFNKGPAEDYIIPFLMVICSVVGKLLTDE